MIYRTFGRTGLKVSAAGLGGGGFSRLGLAQGKSETEIIPEFEKFTVQQLLADGTPNEDLVTYEQADPASMSVAGLFRYWRKYHPEQVPDLAH